MVSYMAIISNVYRIERENDIFSMFPPIKNIKESDIIHWLGFLRNIWDLKGSFQDLINFVKLAQSASPIGLMKMCLELLWGYVKSLLFDAVLDGLSKIIPYGYCHIGGLYVINEESNRFYHCKDIFNEEIDSPY